jgi:hypothetical protein
MDNAPEFHDRFSIHPQSVEVCRGILMSMARSSGLEGSEEEVGSLSDWEAVQRVEMLRKEVAQRTKAMQSLTRSAKATAGQFALLAEALAPVAAEEAAEELELFLAIDHPA